MLHVGTLQLFEARAGRSERELIHANIETIRQAEQLGFHSAWIGEHHFGEYGVCGSPALIIAHAAAVTSSIRLGAGVVLLPLHHPVRIAEDYAMLDVLTEGRLEVGIGRGWQPVDFAGYGIDPAQNQEMFDEGIEILKRAWTQHRTSFRGRHYSLDGVEIRPRPLQQPHPPLWMAAVSESSFKRAGRWGLNLLCSPVFGDAVDVLESRVQAYRRARTEAGFVHGKEQVAVMCIVCVAKTSAMAEDLIRGPATWQFDSLFGYRQLGLRGTVIPGLETYSRIRDDVGVVDFADLVRRGAVVFGDAASVRSRLREICTRLGATHLLCWTRLGGLSDAAAAEVMERLAMDVVPRIAEN